MFPTQYWRSDSDQEADKELKVNKTIQWLWEARRSEAGH